MIEARARRAKVARGRAFIGRPLHCRADCVDKPQSPHTLEPARIIAARGGSIVTKSLQDWLAEGESLYNAAVAEYQDLERQLEELEARLAAKKAEVNQIAQVVGKQPIESSGRRLTAELVEASNVPNSPATIARALTGRGFGR
jgi:hypothetical protein